MKKVIRNIFIAILAASTYTSCESYFDSIPDDTISVDMVFSNRNLAKEWLSNVYSYLPDEGNQNYTGGKDETRGIWTPACLEAKLPWSHNNSNLLTNGTFYPSTDYVENMWTAYYRGIQKANVYIQRIDDCEDMRENERIQSKAEARALRSIFYYNLFKIYGPAVIIGDEVYDPEGDEHMDLVRSSVDEYLGYIIGEFDELLEDGNLISHFKVQEDGLGFNDQYAGNITHEALEAIRSEVLLYAASHLFNGDPFYKNVKDHTGKYLFPQEYDREKWVKARDAAKKFMDNNPSFRLVYRDVTGIVSLYSVEGSCPYNSANEAALGRRTNEEMIFYNHRTEENYTYLMRPRHNMSGDYHKGAGALAAPLQIVDLYFTNKGLRIEDDPDYYNYTNDEEEKFNIRTMTSTADYIDQYSGYVYFSPNSSHRIMNQFYNREPRFYIAFTFNNRRWTFDTSKTYYTELYFSGNSGDDGETHDYPRSGMLVRKKLRTGDIISSNIYIRLTEIYLNYAEACAELGDYKEAIKYVNLIRARAGVAEYGLGGDTSLGARGEERIPLADADVLSAVRRERLIELAYENHHYFDVRRWGVAGMEQGDGWVYPIWHKGGEGGEMVGFSTSEEGVEFYKRQVWETRIYTERMKLFPIPQREINVSPLIVQNAGWEAL